MARDQDYDWLDDPFNERKPQHTNQTGMGSPTKVALGCGCLIIVVVLIVLLIVTGVNMMGVLAS